MKAAICDSSTQTFCCSCVESYWPQHPTTCMSVICSTSPPPTPAQSLIALTALSGTLHVIFYTEVLAIYQYCMFTLKDKFKFKAHC